MAIVLSPSYEPRLFRLTQPAVLLVEGRDEQAMCRIVATTLGIDDLDIVNSGGTSTLKARLGALAQDAGFEGVSGLGIVRDADNDAASAFQSVRDALSQAHLPTPNGPLSPAHGNGLTVAALILPGDGAPGEIEDVCLAAIEGDPRLKCVDDFFGCVASTSTPTKMSKARVQSYLAAMPEHTRTIGVALDKGYFPVASTAFDGVRKLLELITSTS